MSKVFTMSVLAGCLLAWGNPGAFGDTTPIPKQMTAVRLSTQSPNAAVPVLVDTPGRLLIQQYSARSTVSWQISLPSGEVITALNIAQRGGYFRMLGPGIEGIVAEPGSTPIFLSVIEIPDFPVGASTFTVLGGNVTTPEPATVSALLPGTLVAGMTTARAVYVINRPVPIGVLTEHDELPLLGANVTAQIRRPTGVKSTINFADNGVGVDPASGDGVYNGEYIPTETGEFIAVGQVSGTLPNGIAYRRDVETSFHVVTPGAVFNRAGGLQAFEQDLQNDTLYDRIAIVGQLSVTEADDYTAWLTFADSQGRRIKAFAGVKPDPCAANSTPPCGRPFQVFLTADEIRAAEIEFPIHLVEAELTRDTEFGTATVDLWNPPPPPHTNAVVLNISPGARPQEQPMKLSPPMIVNRVDSDADGLFDFLDVTFHVTVVKDGSYWFNAVLKDECDREVARAAANDIQMLGGPALWPVTFRFMGTDIGSHGIDSPWHIAEIMGRTWSFQTTFTGKLGWISPDLANQYENYSPPIDRNRNGIPDDCEVFGGNADQNYNGYPDDVDANPCLMADIADDQGNAPPMPGVPNSGVNEGDFNAFYSASGFFYQASLGPAAIGMSCDIADDQGNVPPQPGIPNSGVNEGDYNAFFNLFLNCQSSSSE